VDSTTSLFTTDGGPKRGDISRTDDNDDDEDNSVTSGDGEASGDGPESDPNPLNSNDESVNRAPSTIVVNTDVPVTTVAATATTTTAAVVTAPATAASTTTENDNVITADAPTSSSAVRALSSERSEQEANANQPLGNDESGHCNCIEFKHFKNCESITTVVCSVHEYIFPFRWLN